jgi:hypothetical protein
LIYAKLLNKRNRNNQQGQAIVEFALTLILLSSFVLFIYQLAMFFAVSSYIQYATFMSARTFFAASDSKQTQMENAKTVFRGMMDHREFKGFIKPVDGEDPQVNFAENPTERGLSWKDGVSYQFKGKIPLAPFGITGDDAWINLTSESWLGREPTYFECKQQLSEGGQGGKSQITFDNGC